MKLEVRRRTGPSSSTQSTRRRNSPPITPCASSRNTAERVGTCFKERIFDAAILVDALRRISDGGTVIDPTIVVRLVGRRRQDPLAELTRRERQVLALI